MTGRARLCAVSRSWVGGLFAANFRIVCTLF
jgi:hypothetical protein